MLGKSLKLHAPRTVDVEHGIGIVGEAGTIDHRMERHVRNVIDPIDAVLVAVPHKDPHHLTRALEN